MKRSIHRNAIFRLLLTLGLVFVAGCQSRQTGDKSGDEMNSAMSAQQKAIIAAHRKNREP